MTLTTPRRLFFPGYYSGFSNNKMSLDIAIALAFLTGRTLLPYRFRLGRRTPVEPDVAQVTEPMLLPDLFDIPVPWSDEYLFKTWVSIPDAVTCAWHPVYDSVLCMPAAPEEDPDFVWFRNGRSQVHTLGPQEAEAADLVISTLSLGHYCHFFYLAEPQRRALVDVMRRVQPKRPYRDAAARIVASLGSFNAIHIRRGDFVHNELSKARITRAASISGQEIVANLVTRMDPDEPLLICTDGSAGEELFGPIQKYFREVVFLDRYLHEDELARASRAGLPRDNESVDALLTQLIASEARVFAGTLFSTFTALIHRFRGFARGESTFLYCYNDFLSPLVRFDRCEFVPVADGPFSWNRVRYPVSPDAYSWLREWPEASDAARPPVEVDAPPSGTLELLPKHATLHGGRLRVDRDGGHLFVTDWTNQDDFVTWEVSLVEGGYFGVETRYGCPVEFAGSEYRVGVVGVQGADELRAMVWNTGGLASLSPWLPLGRLRLPAGRSTLKVYATGKPSYVVMNLYGVRLIPVKRST